MKKVLLFLVIAILSVNGLRAQITHSCGSDDYNENLMNTNPEFRKRIADMEVDIQRIITRQKSQRRAETVYTIPVVVHVIHTGEAVGVGNNISDAQINSGITQLNNAFRNTHSQSVDVNIQFQLATRDESCSATTGINRVDGSVLTDYASMGVERSTTNGAPDSLVKALSRWDRDYYYNFWIISEIDDNGGGAGIQGYAQFAGGTAASDGTIILNSAWGDQGTAKSYTDEGKTIIHEIGHAFNLYHTFQGDNNGASCPTEVNGCAATGGSGDCISDVPAHIRSSSDCNTAGTNACNGNSSNDLFVHNYMDYSSETCQYLFSSEQKTRMRAALEGSRASLITSNGLSSTLPAFAVTAASCTPTTSATGLGGGFAGIMNVQIEGKLNVSTSNTKNDAGYLNKATSCQGAAILDVNTTYEFKTTVWVNTHYVKAWIDYDNDGVFEAGELIYDKTMAASSTDSANFTTPASPTTGSYLRMRVLCDLSSSFTDPCHNPTYGQAEDYVVYINSAAATPPVAAFSGSTTAICVGESVTFNDASTNSPTSWAWTTTGGNPTSSTNQNQAVVYNTAGTYSVSLIATNAGGSDTETKTNYITVSAASVGGTISTDASVCNGSNGATLTLSGHTGNIVRWESSTDNFTNTTSITNTTTTQAYSNLTSTTKYRAVVQSGTCTSANSAEATITVNSLPTVTVNDATICNGDAGATFTATSGTATGWTWSNNGSGTTQTTTGTTAGSYTVVVTDANTCTSLPATGTLTVNALPSVTVNDASICAGGPAATFTATSATAIGWTWSNNGSGTAQTTTGTTAGSYTVAVTDNNGCVGSGTGTLTVNALPSVSLNNHTICSDDPAVTFTATAPTATAYAWSGNGSGTTSTTSGTTAGNYIVVVSDANGCAATDTGELTVNIIPTVTVNSHTICVGDAAATFTATAPTATSYLWSVNGSGTTSTTGGTTAGNYTVTATDIHGCNNDATGTLTVNALPVVSVNNAAVCTGASATTFTATSDSTATSYVWSANGAGTAATTSGTTVGNYTVTLTDNNGCIGSGTGVLSITSGATVALGNDTTICGSNSITLNAGNSGATYLWSTGATTQTISVSAAGSYNVTVNTGGCNGTDTINVSVSNPSVDLANDTTFCGTGTGTLDAGAGFATYAWGNGATTQTLTTSGAGDYHVTVTDINGCSDHDTTTVTFNNPLVDLGNDTSFCGNINETLDAGNFASYVWSTGATTQTINVTASGQYEVTVTDTDGCQDHDTVTVTVTDPTVDLANDTTFCGTGTVTLDAGAGFATYAWGNGATTQTLTTSGAGDYHVIVTDINGCSDHDTMTVTINNPVVDLGNDTSFCGNANITLDAGNSGATYAWSTGSTTQKIVVTAGGQYHVTITDASSCMDHDTINVTVHASPAVSVNSSSICIGDPAATFTATSATATSYVWSANGIGTAATTSGTTAGNYTATVTDGNGCTASATGILTINALPTVTVNSHTTCNGGSAATFTATSATAIGWVWSANGSGTASTTTGTIAGNYTVQVTDPNGCVGSGTGVLIINSNPIVTIDGAFATNYDITGGNVSLTFGQPSGGTYSGNGVTGGVFNTTSAGNGSHAITYNYIDPITGCSGSVLNTLTVSTTTSVTRINSINVSVMPNPFSSHLTVDIANTSETSNYSLIDENGKLVLSGNVTASRNIITTNNNLVPGMYYLRVSNDSNVSTFKVIKLN